MSQAAVLPEVRADTPWRARFAQRTQGVTSSVIRELLKLTEQPDLISFAGGLPAPEVFPVAEIEAAVRLVLEQHAPAALQYSSTEGYLPLRKLLVRHMARYGIRVTPDNVLITSGSQQALDLIGAAPESRRSRPHRSPDLPRSHPGFRRLPGPVRRRSHRRRRAPGRPARGRPAIGAEVPLRAPEFPEPRWRHPESRAPPPPGRAGLPIRGADRGGRLQLKQGTDLHTSTFTQMVAYETARGGFLDRHVRFIRRAYGERRDAMLGAMNRHFPPGVRWRRPQGGLFLWVTLPPGLDSSDLLQDALARNVAFVPGPPFFPAGGGAGTFRLNFSYCPPERIEEGIARLGDVLRRRLGPSAAREP